ncbi:MAG: hypothetical protein LBD46_00035 [Endomicrobium sp.]|jgi:predicted nuclease with TOPRIM domain|nr:hypothetical protein [Endomicrobium sp.]
MFKVSDKITKYAAMAVGFALPYIEEYIDVKKQTAVLNDKIAELLQENSKLLKENQYLKLQVLTAAVAAAILFVAFIIMLLILIIK